MPSKHSVRLFAPARVVLSFSVAILVLLVVWVAVRAVGPAEAARQPSVVLPSMPQVPLVVSDSPAPSSAAPTSAKSSPSPAASSPSPSAARSRSVAPRTSSPSPSSSASKPTLKPVTTAPTPKTTTKPAPQTDIEAQLSVTASWDGGYVAFVRVVNEGDAAAQWRVTVTHSGLNDMELRGTWNASGSQSGSSLSFSGDPLAPGKSATFGYQITKSGRGNARPAGCSAVGGSCSVR
ncbi:cellulose binding domain-containing protein [Actinoplanes sp. NPDC049596]|uniref:cellulose binding domain-containing protein n=1 Tax=unclassified Actinoplanes TaxID=2626549 RepID=UPI003446B7CF